MADEIQLDRIEPPQRYVREDVNQEHVDYLADDIARRGLLEPLLVRPLPDGRYELEVIARDEAVNGAGKGLEGRRTSAPFDVDTTPPRVEDLSAKASKGIAIEFTAVDAGVGIGGASVQLDGGAFLPLSPADGLADSGRERYSITLPATAGPHRVTVRVEDRAGNVGSAKTSVR